MSNDRPFQSPGSDESLQEKFDRLAPEMGLELEKPTVAQRCSVGMAIVPMSRPQARLLIAPPQADTLSVTAASAQDDEAAILKLIREFEAVHPKDLLNKWPTFLTLPFVAVGDRWVDFLDMNDVANALSSREFAEAQVNFPPFSDTERKVEISNAVVTPLGADRASVAYYIVEEYANKARYGGNGVAIVFRQEGTWRVAAFTKHNRGDDMKELAPLPDAPTEKQ